MLQRDFLGSGLENFFSLLKIFWQKVVGTIPCIAGRII